MKHVVTKGIILTRTDYGEADRILHFLTPDQGKISAIAKGVRKSKSKLAGGIELFSVSELSFIIGKSEIYTLTSARLVSYYDNIVKDIDRTNTGYEFIKLLNKATADNPEEDYFNLLRSAFAALDDNGIALEITSLWFKMQLIRLAGHTPNLQSDIAGNKLEASKNYNFDFDRMGFAAEDAREGRFNANHIKFLRLGFSPNTAQVLNRVEDTKELVEHTQPLVSSMLQTFTNA